MQSYITVLHLDLNPRFSWSRLRSILVNYSNNRRWDIPKRLKIFFFYLLSLDSSCAIIRLAQKNILAFLLGKLYPDSVGHGWGQYSFTIVTIKERTDTENNIYLFIKVAYTYEEKKIMLLKRRLFFLCYCFFFFFKYYQSFRNFIQLLSLLLNLHAYFCSILCQLDQNLRKISFGCCLVD